MVADTHGRRRADARNFIQGPLPAGGHITLAERNPRQRRPLRYTGDQQPHEPPALPGAGGSREPGGHGPVGFRQGDAAGTAFANAARLRLGDPSALPALIERRPTGTVSGTISATDNILWGRFLHRPPGVFRITWDGPNGRDRESGRMGRAHQHQWRGGSGHPRLQGDSHSGSGGRRRLRTTTLGLLRDVRHGEL